ncbi:MAG: PilZ domain-containing protein [Tissierellales bacterium]
MDSSELKIGDKIYISKAKYPLNQYSSQILDIINNKELIIGGPIRRSTLIYMRPGTVLDIIYYKEKVGKFFFKANITDVWEKGIYKLKIERIDDVIKIQDRNFFRLLVSLKVEKSYIISKDGQETYETEVCETRDISGGGVKLLTNFKHVKGDKLLLAICIKDMELTTLGEVIRVSEANGSDYKYEIGVKFDNIDNLTRDIIIKFIFEVQREDRRKRIDFYDS